MSKNSYDRGYGFNNFIILDVDRTVINGTSWFYACSYPNLLISSSNTKISLMPIDYYTKMEAVKRKLYFVKKH